MDDATQTPSSPAARLTPLMRICWGLGSLGTISYLNSVTSLVLVYLTTVVRLEPLLAGALVTGARVVDAITDPMMGFVSDRTDTRWGRRRPFLLLGALICGIALPLIYAIPQGLSDSTRVLLVASTLLLYSVGFTVFNVPYLTMPLEMTADPQERVSLISARAAFMTIGTFVGSSLAPLLVEKFGRTAEGFSKMGLVIGAFVFLVMLATFTGTTGAPTRASAVHHWPLREQWRSALENRPFLILMGVKVLQFVGIAAHSSTLAYFVTAVMKRDLKFMALYGIVVGAATITSLLLWRALARRISKRAGFVTGVIGYIALTLSWLASGPAEPMALFILRPVLMGVFASAVLLFGQVVWLDAVDFDYRRTGLRREGVFTSVYVFIERLGYSLAPLMLGALLQAMGFNKNLPLEHQSHGAQLAVILSLVGIPVATFALSLVLLRWYDLTDEKLADTRPRASPGRMAE